MQLEKQGPRSVVLKNVCYIPLFQDLGTIISPFQKKYLDAVVDIQIQGSEARISKNPKIDVLPEKKKGFDLVLHYFPPKIIVISKKNKRSSL